MKQVGSGKIRADLRADKSRFPNLLLFFRASQSALIFPGCGKIRADFNKTV
jgi:hypothetical protein